MQRLILDSLEPAKAAHEREQLSYRGSHYQYGVYPQPIRSRGRVFQLPPRVYDLRATCAYAARRVGKMCRGGGVNPAFQAAFSRAARSLLARDILVRAEQPHEPQARLVTLRGAPPEAGALGLARRMGC